MLKKMYATMINIFDHNFELIIDVYIDVLKYNVDLYISQIQNNEIKSILYNFIIFNSI